MPPRLGASVSCSGSGCLAAAVGDTGVVTKRIGVAMTYLLLAGAIVAEVLGTTALKVSYGFSRLWPSVATVVGYAISFALLAQTLKSMAVGTAYAIWSAVGTALVVAIGIAFFRESLTVPKIIGTALVIAGVVLLNISEH